ncbi:hypothetical protein ACWEIM_30070 [Streptomyces sp. NPDC004778]
MATRLTFLLDGRDHLSRVLDRAGDSANRMHRRISAAATNSSAAMNRFGRTTTDRMAALQRDTGLGAKAVDKLKGSLITLAPAAIPLAASLAPIAPAVGAAAVAAGAYAAALGPQISAMSEAAEAEKKYAEEVKKSGRTSEAAVTAQLEYQRLVADMPPATRRAAASLSVLKDGYEDWSDSLAKDTLTPVTKSFALLNGLLPKTTGLVKGTSRELDRTVTILAGGLESPGLERLNNRFEQFATGTLRKVNNELVQLARTSDTGKVAGGLSEFMRYARANGPAAADTMRNLGQALLNVLEAGSDVGVGMLQVVNVIAKLVASVPPEAIATMLQLAFAIKAVQLAAVGFAAARTGVAAFATSLVAMRVAAAAAPTRLAAVTAAIGTMSRGAKLAAAGTGIGLLVIALMELNQIGRDAPPDVDKMTASLARFADSGKAAGEMARVFGKDLSGLLATLNVMGSAGKGADFFKAFEKSPVGLKEAKKEFEAFDKSLASLVSNGKADLAAAGLARIKAQMEAAGYSTDGLKGRLTEYNEALANVAFEEQLAAQAMGLFGQQALAVQTKLDAQKASADGLRQSIQALNDAQRSGLGGMIGFEAAIDAATAAIKGNRDALSMSGGQLNLNSEKARSAATALNDLAAKTDEAAAQARQSGASWSTVNGIYAKGRAALIRSADAMGLTRNEAKALADQILRTPDKTARLKGNLEDLEAKLSSAKAKLKSVPDSRRAKVLAEISDLQRKIGQAKYALSTLQNKTVTVTTRYVVVGDSSAARRSGSEGSQLKYANGGLVGFPGGGMVTGPGTGTSDSILARVSNGEFVVRARSVAKYGAAFLSAINEGRLGMAATVGGGGMAGAGAEAGRGLSAGLRGSAAGVDASARVMAAAVTSGVRAELEIASPSKKMQALMKDVGKGLILGLTGEKSKISATAKDLVKDIWAAWKGVKTNKDSALVAMVTRDTKKLQALASQRDALKARIAAAKDFAKGITAGVRQDASLGQLGIEQEDVSAGTIKAGLQQKLAKLKTFTSYIKTLAKRGLNKSLLRQVLEMGPDQGYAYASALVGADASTFKAINSLTTQINHGADALGKTGADVMYDSGKNAGKGYLKGLSSQQKAIEAQMLKIAKAMDKAIRKALGIKSPSTVMAQLGRHTTEGLAVGMRDRMPVLDQALTAVTDRVAGMRPVVGRPAFAGGGAVVHNHYQVDVHGAMDPVAVGRELQKVLVKFGRAQGATVQLKVG